MLENKASNKSFFYKVKVINKANQMAYAKLQILKSAQGQLLNKI